LRNKLFKNALISSVALALCCFTPILVIFLAFIGLTSVVIYKYSNNTSTYILYFTDILCL